jgi:hypothetical protein
MHQPIRDNLEEYLKGSARGIPPEFHAHLEVCEDCANELRLFENQAGMLRSLQRDGDLDPRAGFYARVMDKIELEGRSTIWSVLLQPHFGRRLAMASAVLVMLLGTYFVTTEAVEPEIASTDVVYTGPPAAAASQDSAGHDSVIQQRQRDAVLVNLAAYHE